MKTKFIVMAAMAAMFSMGFTACSNNDDEMANQKIAEARGDAMTFSAYSDYAHVTRGYATNSGNVVATIPNFMTWAYEASSTTQYMGNSGTVGRVVSYNAVEDTQLGHWVYEPVQFWPVNALNFVAVAPVTGSSASPVLPAGLTITSTANATGVTTITTGLTVPTTVGTQCDVMFAEGNSITKDGADATPSTADDGNVPFVFKHALSQIVFKGKFSDNGAITKATVAEISLCNVYQTGVIPFTSTGLFYTEANTDARGQVAAGDLSTPANFTLTGSDLEDLETTGNGIYTLAEQDDDPFWMTMSDNNTLKNAWFMLPQTVTAWDGSSVDGSGVPNDGGAYIKLRVKLEKNGVVIKDNAASDAVYLPLSVNWDRSKKYIYTIEFNGANALTPITFSVAAQDWTDVDVTPVIEM